MAKARITGAREANLEAAAKVRPEMGKMDVD
jgi:hypothetical protein